MERRPASRTSWRVLILVGLALVVGCTLRLLWGNDMEYKGDEAWTFQMTQEIGRTQPFPTLGMPTSHNVRHPGGTVWWFWALARAFDAETPEELGRACQIWNGLALILLVCFIFHSIPVEDREPWFWAVALVACNPIQVLFHRKIWPPCVVPFFTVVFVWCWWYRHRPLGSFLWGLVGALLVQLYPACMFMTGGFFVWALLFDRKSIRLGWWTLGSMLGALTLIPWFLYIWGDLETNPISQRKIGNAFEGKFWMRWLTEPMGLSLQYSLASDFADFLRYPILNGRGTYLVAIAHGVMLLASGWIILRALRRLWISRRDWFVQLIGRGSSTTFTVQACFWGFGILFTLSLLPIHRHYMIITFPLMFLWLAVLALNHTPSSRVSGRTLLATLCGAHLLICSCFLDYVHSNPRAIGTGLTAYGVPYSAQPARNAQAVNYQP
jgi:hypothetical protein